MDLFNRDGEAELVKAKACPEGIEYYRQKLVGYSLANCWKYDIPGNFRLWMADYFCDHSQFKRLARKAVEIAIKNDEENPGSDHYALAQAVDMMRPSFTDMADRASLPTAITFYGSVIWLLGGDPVKVLCRVANKSELPLEQLPKGGAET